jgi:cyclopropane fatty-acyl-phospholipid synthase-like methyltransferase
MTKLDHPSSERNKEPILEVLRRILPKTGTVLEIAGGSGQHAVFFAKNLPGITWLPTDIDEERLASIRAWREDSTCDNLLEPRRLDVLDDDWGIGTVDVIFSSNMIHITPWECCLGLLAGARRHLTAGGLLVFYGPFSIGGEHTAPSNAAFDDSLRGRDPSWGVRDLDAIGDAASGLVLEERDEMPANNQILVFRRA